jgi:aminoglycoside phosphotransferase (APT) family kinase protein
MSAIDVGGTVRAGEELDAVAVENWLKAQGVDLQGQVEVTQYSGGASNWTYRLKYDNVDLILRRPPKGTKAKSAHDMAREYHVQKNLTLFILYFPKWLHCVRTNLFLAVTST